MTENAPEPADTGLDQSYKALVDLHSFSPITTDEEIWSQFDTSLLKVIRTDESTLPVSGRLDLAYSLAGKGFAANRFRPLVVDVAARRKLDPDQLLRDLQQAAAAKTPFRLTESGRQLKPYDTAFVGEDVCTVRAVTVDGKRAVWIYSEIETDASLDAVAEWVDPRSWPSWGPLMFRKMELVGGIRDPLPLPPPPPSDPHWHGVFQEEVQLVDTIDTLLRCAYFQDDRTAGMTYELNLSLDQQLDVDRGYLLVTDRGATRSVQALKIVGFTRDLWDAVAGSVCPFWTLWLRGAIAAATSDPESKASDGPPHQGSGSDRLPLEDRFRDCVHHFRDSARTYLDIFDTATFRISERQYSTADLLADGQQAWVQMARDWAEVWAEGPALLGDLATRGQGPRTGPPDAAAPVRGAGPARAGVRTPTTGAASTANPGIAILVPGLAADDRPRCGDLTAIEAAASLIPGGDIDVVVVPLGDGTFGVQLQTGNTSAPAGLYVGQLDHPPGAPVQLYLSRATEA